MPPPNRIYTLVTEISARNKAAAKDAPSTILCRANDVIKNQFQRIRNQATRRRIGGHGRLFHEGKTGNIAQYRTAETSIGRRTSTGVRKYWCAQRKAKTRPAVTKRAATKFTA